MVAHNMPKRKDLTGQKFGRLTVIEYSHYKRYKNQTKVYWKCKCDCGNECIVESGKLKSGHTKSCGCLSSENRKKYEDLTGKKFNRLTVVGIDHTTCDGKRYWLCNCDCGNKTIVIGSSLKSGMTKSCGCLAKEKQYKSHKKFNTYYIVDNIAYFIDSNGKKFIVDIEDVEKIKGYCWLVNKDGYVETKSGDSIIRLYRLIMNTPKKMIVDHINRKPWDNRKCNLRNTNANVNARNITKGKNNTSGYLGVSFHKQTGKWRAFVTVNYKTIHLGLFDNIEDAICARKKGEIEYYGEEIS